MSADRDGRLKQMHLRMLGSGEKDLEEGDDDGATHRGFIHSGGASRGSEGNMVTITE